MSVFISIASATLVYYLVYKALFRDFNDLLEEAIYVLRQLPIEFILEHITEGVGGSDTGFRLLLWSPTGIIFGILLYYNLTR